MYPFSPESYTKERQNEILEMLFLAVLNRNGERNEDSGDRRDGNSEG